MISIEEINLLKGQNEALLKQNKDLQKQVLNLNAENVSLKKELECSINLRKQIQNDLLKSDRLNDNLEAENTELKAENERLKRENEIITGIYNSVNARFDKIYQTLQEIKAIAENNIDCTQYEIDHDCFNDTRCKALREQIEILQQILDLISKAEEE